MCGNLEFELEQKAGIEWMDELLKENVVCGKIGCSMGIRTVVEDEVMVWVRLLVDGRFPLVIEDFLE